MENNLALQLRQQSKSAMILGIVGEAVSSVLAMVSSCIFMVSAFGSIFSALAHYADPDPRAVLFAAQVLLILLMAVGAVRLVFGIVTWTKANRAARFAKAHALRRHPMSVVALVFGIEGVVTGAVILLSAGLESIVYGVLGQMI